MCITLVVRLVTEENPGFLIQDVKSKQTLEDYSGNLLIKLFHFGEL
jgi:hypothetical protein